MTTAGALGLATALLPTLAALHHAADRRAPTRWRNTAFWGALAITAMAGPVLPDLVDGLLVLLMVLLATIGLKPGPVQTTGDAERRVSAHRLGGRLFLPALSVPVLVFGGSLLLPHLHRAGHALVEPKLSTLAALAAALLFALLLAIALTRPARGAVVSESRRLIDAFGWATVLPQMLAALGGIFVLAGVGRIVASGTTALLPGGSVLAAVVTLCVGMAGFTMLIGNAFTAFPIMMAGVGVPIVIQRLGGDPAAVSAIAMLSGFCGTLMTPMAATFNIVPVTLLQLGDRNAVIRVQVPTALLLLAINIGIMRLFAFPGVFS